VPHTTRTGQVIRSASRCQPSRVAFSINGPTASQRAAPRIRWASSPVGMCSKFEVMYCVARRRPSALARIASACGGGLERVLHRGEMVDRLFERLVALGPPAGWGQCHHRLGSTARSEMQGDVAAQGVADDVRSPKPASSIASSIASASRATPASPDKGSPPA
jgi:hypothetical protein